MWFENLLENWHGATIVFLTAFQIGKSVIKLLPSFSLKKFVTDGNQNVLKGITHGTNEMISSGKIIYEQAQELIKIVKVKDAQIESKDKQIDELVSLNALLIANMNIPKDLKTDFYQVLKQVDGVTDIVAQSVKKSIDLQEKQARQTVDLSHETDSQLDGV